MTRSRQLATLALLAAATAGPALARAPMAGPTPNTVVESSQRTAPDRTAMSPMMKRTTYAIMMPGEDMPRRKAKPPRRAR